MQIEIHLYSRPAHLICEASPPLTDRQTGSTTYPRLRRAVARASAVQTSKAGPSCTVYNSFSMGFCLPNGHNMRIKHA